LNDARGPAANPYQPPGDEESPPGPRPTSLSGCCLGSALTGIGALGSGVLGSLLGWWLLIGPDPGPGFHRVLPLIAGVAACAAALGGGAGFLLARKLGGKSNRAASGAVAGLILAGAGLASLTGSLSSGPFLTYQTTAVRNADGTFTRRTRHWDHEFSGLLILAGSGLALWGWRRRRSRGG